MIGKTAPSSTLCRGCQSSDKTSRSSTQQDAGVGDHAAAGRAEERIDVDGVDPALQLHHEGREGHQGFYELPLIHRLGPAISSGAPIFIYGPAGNGKTTIAEAIGNALPETVYLPYAILVGGQIVGVFDPVNHTPVAVQAAEAAKSFAPDHPAVVACYQELHRN